MHRGIACRYKHKNTQHITFFTPSEGMKNVIYYPFFLFFFFHLTCKISPYISCSGDENPHTTDDCLLVYPEKFDVIMNASMVGNFQLSWQKVAEASSYTLQEFCSPKQMKVAEIPWDTGNEMMVSKEKESVQITGKSEKMFCWYRLRACNDYGCGTYSDSLFVGIYIFLGGVGTEADPFIIDNCTGLGAIHNNLSAYYRLSTDIAAAKCTRLYPIGTQANPFTGTFDGAGHVITNFSIVLSGPNGGFFGYANGAHIHNLGLKNVKLLGSSYSDVGALIGRGFATTIENTYVTGSIRGGSHAGGIAGNLSNHSLMSNVYAISSVKGNFFVGGLVGNISFSSRINNAFAISTVNGEGYIGGLVGSSGWLCSVSNTYTLASVVGSEWVGGLSGSLSGAILSNSYALANINADRKVGGLVGEISGSISSVQGLNYFTASDDSNGDSDGVGAGICSLAAICEQKPEDYLKDELDEGASSGMKWDLAVWGNIGLSSVFPCLRNMPKDAIDCP